MLLIPVWICYSKTGGTPDPLIRNVPDSPWRRLLRWLKPIRCISIICRPWNIPAEGFKSQEDLRAEIVNEYRREFFGEGQMFFTYKRMGATTMLWRNEDVSEENYIVALPDTEYNPNL